MARLHTYKKLYKEQEITRILQNNPLGITEAELSQELNWQRRTVNNYLRSLPDVYKDGYYWYMEE